MISKIKSIQGQGGPSTFKDGTQMYSHEVTLQDGTTGIAWSKNQDTPYGEGDEVEYTITGKNKHGDTKLSIKKAGYTPQANQPRGNQPQGSRDLQIVRQNVLNRAVELYLSGDADILQMVAESKDTLKGITEVADYFTDWVMSKTPKKEVVEGAKKLTGNIERKFEEAAIGETEDDLPF